MFSTWCIWRCFQYEIHPYVILWYLCIFVSKKVKLQPVLNFAAVRFSHPYRSKAGVRDPAAFTGYVRKTINGNLEMWGLYGNPIDFQNNIMTSSTTYKSWEIPGSRIELLLLGQSLEEYDMTIQRTFQSCVIRR